MFLRRAVSAPGYRDAHQPRRPVRPASLPPHHQGCCTFLVFPTGQPTCGIVAHAVNRRIWAAPSLPHNRDSSSSVRDASTFYVSHITPLPPSGQLQISRQGTPGDTNSRRVHISNYCPADCSRATATRLRNHGVGSTSHRIGSCYSVALTNMQLTWDMLIKLTTQIIP